MNQSHGQVLDLHAIFGLKAVVTVPSATTDGAYVEMDVTAAPGSKTLIHRHPKQEETYHVLEGTLEVFRDGQWHPVPTGEAFTVPQGTVHGFRNAGEMPVRFRNVHRPALGFQTYLETLDHLSKAGKVRGTKDPRSLMYLSMAWDAYRPDVPVKPPQRVVQGLAFIGRRLGYRLDG